MIQVVCVTKNFSHFSVPHEKICYDDHRNDEKREVICFTRRPHHLSSGSQFLLASFSDLPRFHILVTNLTVNSFSHNADRKRVQYNPTCIQRKGK